MLYYSPAQIKAIVIAPMITGWVSAIVSGTLITTILKSEKKLTLPLKRIICGLCIYNCIFSVSCALSSLPTPKDLGTWGAHGNVYSCDFQGFSAHSGFVGSILYSGNLGIYYFYAIRMSMSDDRFSKKIEPYCHLITNLWVLIGAIFLLSKGYFNDTGSMCWIGPHPIDCINNPEVECLRGGEDAYLFRWIFAGYPALFSCFIFIACLGSTVITVNKHRKNSERWASGGRESSVSIKPFTRGQSILNNIENQVSRSSISSMYPGKYFNDDPLAFDLKAVRAKTRGRSLISKIPHSQIDESPSVLPRRYSTKAVTAADMKYDPYPFDIKTVRAVKRNSLRSERMQRQTLKELRRSIRINDELRRSIKISGDLRRSIKGTNDLRCSVKMTSDLERNIRFVQFSEQQEQHDQHATKDRKITRLKHSDKDNVLPLEKTEGTVATCSHSEEKPLRLSSSMRDIKPRRERSGASISSRGPSTDLASREVKIQSLLYTAVAVTSFVFPIIHRVLEERNKAVPFICLLLKGIIHPSLGFLYVLVYCRPYAISLRRENPEYTWLKAFWLTLKSGGDNDSSSKRSVGSRKPSKKLVDKIQQNHIARMESIRQSRRQSLFNSVPTLRNSWNQAVSTNVDGVDNIVPKIDREFDECSNGNVRESHHVIDIEACNNATDS